VFFLVVQGHRLYPGKSPPTLELGRRPEGGVSVGMRIRFP
jgi:hypothetical protein